MDEQGHPTIKNPWLAEGSKVLQMLPDAVNRDQLLDSPRLEGFPNDRIAGVRHTTQRMTFGNQSG